MVYRRWCPAPHRYIMVSSQQLTKVIQIAVNSTQAPRWTAPAGITERNEGAEGHGREKHRGIFIHRLFLPIGIRNHQGKNKAQRTKGGLVNPHQNISRRLPAPEAR